MKKLMPALVTILIFVLLLSYGKHDPLRAWSPVSPLHTTVSVEQMCPTPTPTPSPNTVVITNFETAWTLTKTQAITIVILLIVAVACLFYARTRIK